MIIDCNRLWSQLATLVYRLRRKPRVELVPPPRQEQRHN